MNIDLTLRQLRNMCDKTYIHDIPIQTKLIGSKLATFQ